MSGGADRTPGWRLVGSGARGSSGTGSRSWRGWRGWRARPAPRSSRPPSRDPLGLLLRCDVGEDPVEERWTAGLVVHHNGLVADPDDAPVVGPQPVLTPKWRPHLSAQDLIGHRPLAVLRNHLLVPQGGVGQPFLRREAEHRLDPGTHVPPRPVLPELGDVHDDRDLFDQRAIHPFGIERPRAGHPVVRHGPAGSWSSIASTV